MTPTNDRLLDLFKKLFDHDDNFPVVNQQHMANYQWVFQGGRWELLIHREGATALFEFTVYLSEGLLALLNFERLLKMMEDVMPERFRRKPDSTFITSSPMPGVDDYTRYAVWDFTEAGLGKVAVTWLGILPAA